MNLRKLPLWLRRLYQRNSGRQLLLGSLLILVSFIFIIPSIMKSDFHLSDALRFISNFKYGGYYFDLDVIQLRSVESRHRNFVLAEPGSEFLGSAVFHVEYKHPVMQLALDEFRNTYRKDIWGYNGPELFTRIMKRWCGVDDILLMITGNQCSGFRVLPSETFYPFSWPDLKTYFVTSKAIPEWSEEVIGIHVWNKRSGHYPVYKFSNQVYAQLASTQCPLTFEKEPAVF